MSHYIQKWVRNKKEGSVMIAAVSSIMLLTILFFILLFAVRIHIVKMAAVQIEDGLTVSALSSLNIDFEQYLESSYRNEPEIVISDIYGAYHMFCSCLKENLDLKEDGSSINQELYNDVKIKEYRIYNVFGDEGDESAECFLIRNDQVVEVEIVDLSELFAPNGIKIRETSVYAEVTYRVENLNHQPVLCHREIVTGVTQH